MTLAPLRLSEAADSLVKASTPEPFSASKTSNWVARRGGLPDYVQHIAHDLLESGRAKDESSAIRLAIGIVQNPPRNWGADARAAAAKASAEWEKMKGTQKAVGAAGKLHASYEDELAVMRGAMGRLVVFERQLGQDGLVGLLAEGMLAEAETWAPTLKRTASAMGEKERHEVYDGAQHVGTLTRRAAYGRSEPDRYSAKAVNGQEVGSHGATSKQDALKALQTHLAEAPARVLALPAAGKFLVARPSSYGETTYTQFPNEIAARHAAGLPASPTVPEVNSKVDSLAEMLRFDLTTVSGMDVPVLRRAQEARRLDPFDLIAERFDAGELRGFGGKWEAGGRARGIVSGPGMKLHGPKSDAATKYDGGVVRASAKARAAHAAKPQHSLEQLPGTIGSGRWDSAARRAVAALPKGTTADHFLDGRAADTEHAHREQLPGGKMGEYSPGRQALHEQIIANLLQGKQQHPGRAEAHFTAGGPASGKSGLEKFGMLKLPKDVVHANPDIVREMLPEYKQLMASGRADIAAAMTHEEASHVAKVVTRLALGRQHHILVDTVGNSGPGKFAGKVQAAISAGHKTSVHYATTDVNTAIARAAGRTRKVPTPYLKDAHQAVSQRFGDIAKIKGLHQLQVVDTTARPNTRIAEIAPGTDKLVIRNAEMFRKFLAKGKG